MSKLIGRLLVVLAFGWSGMATSALIDNGDTTIDTNTGLEWLDLTLTKNQSYNSILGGYGGYLADGYIYATSSQLCGIWGSLGDDVSNCLNLSDINSSDLLQQASATTLTTLLGATLSNRTQIGTYGMYDSGLIDSGRNGLGCIDSGSNSVCLADVSPPKASRADRWTNLDYSQESIGSWLVRSAEVPTPATIPLLGIALAALGFSRRRKFK